LSSVFIPQSSHKHIRRDILQSLIMKLYIATFLLLYSNVVVAFTAAPRHGSEKTSRRLSATVDKVKTTLIPPQLDSTDIAGIYGEHVQTTYGYV
jgi:hypothetical protein